MAEWDRNYYEELAGKALDALGSTPVDRLREMGIKGERLCGSSCLIANYLYETVPPPEGTGWFVTSGQIYIDEGMARYGADALNALIEPPKPVEDVIKEFDHGFLSDLEFEGGF